MNFNQDTQNKPLSLIRSLLTNLFINFFLLKQVIMRLTFLLLIALSMWSSSCETTPPVSESTGSLEITFKTRYGSQPFVLYKKTATGQTNPTDILVKKLEFFLSDITGTDSKGINKFSEVDYVSMASSISNAAAENGTTLTLNELPIGSYSTLNFAVGLSDATNATTPGEYDSSSPLALNANYWASWNSYILCKMEGDVTKSDGTIGGFLYHSGVNGMQQARSLNHNFDITAGQTTKVVVHINVDDIFFQTGDEIDMINNNQTHSGAVGSTEYNLAKKAIKNLANALVIQS